MDIQPIDIELDTLLAGQAMGWKRTAAAVAQTQEPATLYYVHKSRGVHVGRASLIQKPGKRDFHLHTFYPWTPTGYILHALEVADLLEIKGWWMKLEKSTYHQGLWLCEFKHYVEGDRFNAAWASRELAICHAARQVVL